MPALPNSDPDRSPGAPEPVTRAQAFAFWLKLGFISFGGPAGQIAIMHEELVERRRWISERRFLHALNYCMVLPGPEAQQLATYIGWLMHRTWGGIVAGGLFVLPSLFILIALSWVYVAYGSVPVVAGIFYGIKPAVTALVVHAAWRIGSRALEERLAVGDRGRPPSSPSSRWTCRSRSSCWRRPRSAISAGGSRPSTFQTGGGHGTARAFGPALIDDDTPTPRARAVHLAAVPARAGGVPAACGCWPSAR